SGPAGIVTGLRLCPGKGGSVPGYASTELHGNDGGVAILSETITFVANTAANSTAWAIRFFLLAGMRSVQISS
ncbi:MAG: hypothetical protein Q6370_018600, partial [Candidatus Sigynarchaeota archaeon]